MRIALLYPNITADGFAKGLRPKTGWLQHGLCYISSVLKKEGHDVRLIDLRQLTGWDELPSVVRDAAPDIVGITAMTLDFDAAVRSARIIKEVSLGIKTVIGGVHASIMDTDFLGNPDIDYIFKGEAEVTLPKVIGAMAEGSIREKVLQGEMPDLDSLPLEDRHLFRVLEAPIVPFLKMPFISIVAGRGCRYNCNFCQPAERMIFGRKVRRMSVEHFIEELNAAERQIGLNSLMIHDDCFVEDIEWVERFLKAYSAEGFGKPFICQARADIIVKNPRLFRDMKRHGLALVFVGFESGSQRLLNFLRKGTTVEQNYRAAEICRRLGIRVFANFMLGIPTETKEEALETVRMIKRIKPYVPSPAFYTPFPGSDLFEYCKKNGLSLISRHEEYVRNPIAPKIKGIDYDFLNRILADAVSPPPSVKLRRKIDRLRLGRFNKELIANYNVQ